MSESITPAGDEYGNYKKFQGQNKVYQTNDKAEHDLGFNKYQENLRHMMNSMEDEDREFPDELSKFDEGKVVKDLLKSDITESTSLFDRFVKDQGVLDKREMY